MCVARLKLTGQEESMRHLTLLFAVFLLMFVPACPAGEGEGEGENERCGCDYTQRCADACPSSLLPFCRADGLCHATDPTFVCGCDFSQECVAACPSAGLPICGDDARCHEAEAGCRNTQECLQMGSCVHPDDEIACGIPPPETENQCSQVVECQSPDTVCDYVVEGCGGTYLGCVARCDLPGGGCLDGEACVNGRCEAIPCAAENLDDAFVCPAHRICSGEVLDPLSDDRDHGCALIACDTDADCLSDFCVNGTCSSAPGRCELPRP